jgi:SAM-dependent methyltransferase
MPLLKAFVARLVRDLAYPSPLFRRHIFPRYTFGFSPPQLCFLCQCLEDTARVEGGIVEVGCHTGQTTVFLNKYLDARGIHKEYVALDTFSGTTARDIDFEVAHRGKARDVVTGFTVNSKRWFDMTMKDNGVARVRSVKADANGYDLRSLGPLSFALLDVDLYRPTRKALPELYDALGPGGMIVVDDCDPSDLQWDGADQAYREFVRAAGLPLQIVHGALGVVTKRSSR